jgi:photosystem II stability/assembly factor-like uncharacterized protein
MIKEAKLATRGDIDFAICAACRKFLEDIRSNNKNKGEIKMRIIITALIMMMFTVQIKSQWVIQQFHPDHNGVSFNSTSTGYMACSNGVILKSTNNGHSWVSQYTGTTQDLTSISFFDTNTGWAVGWGGTVLKTTNGGTNWIPQSAGTTDILWDVEVARGDTAIAVGIYNKVFRTTNGGLNWQSQTLGTGASSTYSVYFYSYTEGYICDGFGDVYTTSNAGLTWVYRTTAPSSLFSITRISSTVIACGNAGTIIRSTNAGINWTTIPSGTAVQLFSVTQTSPTVFLIAVDDGAILRSTNSGANFYEAAGPVAGFDLNEIVMCDSVHIIAVGDRGDIRHSSDAGVSWSVVSGGDPNDIQSIYFAAPLTGYAVNNNGIVFKTTNGGALWNETYAGSYNLKDVWFTNTSTGYACSRSFSLNSSGSSSNIIKTTNGGSNWNETTFNNISALSSITFADASTGWVLGISPVTANPISEKRLTESGNSTILFKTTNAGLNWQPVHLFTESVNQIYFVSAQTGWACGFSGFMEKTTNGGLSWNVQSTGTTGELYSVYFLNNSQGYTCGENGTILATTNAGTNWTALTTGTTNYLYSIHFGSSSSGVCIGERGTRLRTLNGGITWVNQPELSDMELGDCFMPTAVNAYVCGPMGYIANIGGIITSTELISNTNPNEFSLEQNYPNPFNPKTIIRFHITELSESKIIVYDILGKEIATLINEKLQPGSYDINFDGTHLASGVYFYKLETKNFIETKKMMLIK